MIDLAWTSDRLIVYRLLSTVYRLPSIGLPPRSARRSTGSRVCIAGSMGNQQSSSHHASHAHPHPHPHPHPHGNANANANAHAQSQPQPHSHSHLSSQNAAQTYRTGRRESIQHTIKAAQIAPPSASLESAQADTTAHVTSQPRAAHDRSTVHDASPDKMGNEQSSQKKEREREERQERLERLSRQSTPQPAPTSSPAPPPPPPASTTAASNTTPLQAPPQQQQQQQQQSSSSSSPPPPPPPGAHSSTPPPSEVHAIPIEAPHCSRTEQAIAGSLDPADASQDYLVPSSHFSRPPRLPLPIEEELHTPGSPIISPNDPASPLDHGEVEGTLPRRTSMLSSTTIDDDDLGEEFKVPTPGHPTVPTLIEWEGAGDRVYVTGTFAGWNRKYRLHNK
ncbi:galactose metabolism- protein [Ascochyta clinopodiicola]|nr:galactose metabolism- protein [Ascochyta clinopodiicola]